MNKLNLSRDAVTVLGLAGIALRFAQSVDDEVERWLRPLRLYGESGATLRGLGVCDAREEASVEVAPERSSLSPEETLHVITIAASELAADRGASSLGTQDILQAVMAHYGEAFQRALEAHAGDSSELANRIADQTVSGLRVRRAVRVRLSPSGLA